ncbi:Site-specific recombinase XerD [Ruminococcaceae bacterium FB2012]|nr:Site-specific recombinase XerD [Ruminococcaceae bacterium FB2012]
MARIEKQKNGSYRIQISTGYSADGKHHKTQSMTWHPEKGMTERQIKKALDAAVAEFEQECRSGKRVVNTCKLENFIEQWFEIKSGEVADSTIKKYRDYCPRVFEQLGHLRMDKITTFDIDNFVVWLKKQTYGTKYGRCKIDLQKELAHRKETQKAFAARAGVSANAVRSCYQGERIRWEAADKIAAVLDKKVTAVFDDASDNKPLSAKTIHGYHGFLSSVFSYAVARKAIRENPCDGVILPKIEKEEHAVLTIEEATLLLKTLKEFADPKYFIFFLLAIYTGGRRGEVIALRWKDIDFDQHTVNITRTLKFEKKKGNYYTTPKSKKSNRTVLISDNTVQELKAFKAKQEDHAQKIGDLWHDEDLIFTQFNGRQMGISTPYGFIKKFAEKHDLVPTTIHQLRHTNATILIHSGTDVKTLQEWLGHSSAQVTLDIYSHELQASKMLASKAISDALDKSIAV